MHTSTTQNVNSIRHAWRFMSTLLFLGLFSAFQAQALTISVVDPSGVPVPNYRWLVLMSTAPTFHSADCRSTP